MTLKTSIHAAVAPVLGTLLTEFGATVVLRRPYTVEQADGSSVMELRAVVGAEPSYMALFEVVTRATAERLWGRETNATVKGMVADTVPMIDRDVLVVQDGPLAGRTLTVENLVPSDIGGVVGFSGYDVPTVTDRGFA